MEAIKTENLTKEFKGCRAVNGLNLTVGEGELFALLGINGAGKSTTIQMLCTLLQPSSGDALLYGHSIKTEGATVKQLIGISPQETAVAPHLTVKENLELMAGAYGMSKKITKEKIDDLVKTFCLSSVLGKRSGQLSGGYGRRLSIAMAMLGEPRILFLDEPTLGLDVIARAELWETIRSMKGHRTIVLTTHYMEEAEALSDRIGIMKNGTLIAIGTAAALKAQSGQTTLEAAFIQIVKEAKQ